MKVVIFAAGNQTRFGLSVAEQPKVLFPLKNKQTILSNTLSQLDKCDLENITITVADKENVATYIRNIAASFKTPLIIDEFKPIPFSSYPWRYQKLSPVTFIFGDIYFPNPALINYFETLRKEMANKRAFIGASPIPVGDYHLQTNGHLIANISKEGPGEYFTCGLFTILDDSILDKINKTEKITEIFAQFPGQGLDTGYAVLPKGIIDMDTPDKIDLLKASLASF